MDEHQQYGARDRSQGIWIEHSDRLYVAAYSSVASLSVTFSGYFRKMDKEIIEYSVTVNPTSDRAVTEGNVFFGAGFLLSCVANLSSGNANRGQCYVRAMVQRSTGTPMVKLHNVVGGYVTDNESPSFPYGKIEGSLDGAGMWRMVAGSDPAAGADISETVPTGARWRLHSLRASLVTDGTVQNRQPHLIIDDGSVTCLLTGAATAQVASTTVSYNFANWGTEDITSTLAFSLCLPIFFLPAGWRIRTTINGGVAGDNWGQPILMVEEYLEA